MAEENIIRFTHIRFGEQAVCREKMIFFPDGLPGFEAFKRYALFEAPDNEPFQWLLCVDNPRLGFVVVNPRFIWPDYDPQIAGDDLKTLGVSRPEDMLLFCIVTLADDPGAVTANLSGPIILNALTRKARQLALFDDRYATKHKILDAMKQR